MKRLFNTALAALTVLGSVPALADTFPSKSVTLIAPFPAGGSTDVLARLIATRLGARAASRSTACARRATSMWPASLSIRQSTWRAMIWAVSSIPTPPTASPWPAIRGA